MRIGILGTGDVGRALGSGFVTLGHQVKIGSRSTAHEKATQWADGTGGQGSVGIFAEAAEFGEVVVLATLGTAYESVLSSAGADRLTGKVLIDATNPLDFSEGLPPKLAFAGYDSAGERVQRFIPGALVVKAFNTVGHALMFRPDISGGPPDMFICGNDRGAKSTVSQLLEDFGWGVVDLGGVESSRYLEAMCLVWVLQAFSSDPPRWDHAFKMLRE